MNHKDSHNNINIPVSSHRHNEDFNKNGPHNNIPVSSLSDCDIFISFPKLNTIAAEVVTLVDAKISFQSHLHFLSHLNFHLHMKM